VGLSSILKGYGLLEGQDFVIQYNVGFGDGAKRPDAVLFIRDNVFVIDSKASKFFLELAEAEGTAREAVVLDNIKKSMNLHLNSLASKGYIEAVKDDIKKNRSDFEIGHMQMVMFLCNESHVEKIAQADPDFIAKAIAKDIVISGPTGLQGLLAFARYSIARQRRDKNRELLIDEIRTLLGSISTVVGHTLKVGSGIKSAAKNYENLVSSINSNLLSKADKIIKLGMPLPGNKPLPSKLENFEIISHSQRLVEGEAVEEDAEAENDNSKVLELVVG
jgi:DNA recombination protein RmuC